MTTMVDDELYFEQFISSQRNAIKYYVIFAAGICLLGIIIIILGLSLPEDTVAEGIKTVFLIGGGFVSSLCGFPLKEIIARKDKIGIFSIMKKQLEVKIKDKNKPNEDEVNRLREIMWKTIEKTALA